MCKVYWMVSDLLPLLNLQFGIRSIAMKTLKVTSGQEKLLHFVHGGLYLTRVTKSWHQWHHRITSMNNLATVLIYCILSFHFSSPNVPVFKVQHSTSPCCSHCTTLHQRAWPTALPGLQTFCTSNSCEKWRRKCMNQSCCGCCCCSAPSAGHFRVSQQPRCLVSLAVALFTVSWPDCILTC